MFRLDLGRLVLMIEVPTRGLAIAVIHRAVSIVFAVEAERPVDWRVREVTVGWVRPW